MIIKKKPIQKKGKIRYLALFLITCFFIILAIPLFISDEYIKSNYFKLYQEKFPQKPVEYSKYYKIAEKFSDFYSIDQLLKEIKQRMVDIPILELHLSFNNYQLLKNKVDEIRIRNENISDRDKELEVPGRINFNKNSIKVKVRLKGLYLDHLEGKKWSFKIQTKGDDLLLGLNRFSLQNPKTRNNINEWIYQKANNEEGLLNLQYHFVKVRLNGEDLGIYAIEEFFDKYLIERNKKREGMIVKIHSYNIQGMQNKKIEKNTKLQNTLNDLNLRYTQYLNRRMNPNQLFDFDSTAKYFALADIFAGSHGHLEDNFVAYLNPITNLLEPIPFDGNVGGWLHSTDHKLFIQDDYRYSIWHSSHFFNLFKNEQFMIMYLTYLKKYSTKGYFDQFIEKTKQEREDLSNILYSEGELSRYSVIDDQMKNDFLIDNATYGRNFFAEFSTDDLKKIAKKIIQGFGKNQKKDLYQQINNQSYLKYFKINKDKSLLRLKVKHQVINENIIIPSDMKVVLEKGESIQLINKANIISYSALIFNGTHELPITIDASDRKAPGGGIVVINAKEESRLHFVNFKGLSAPVIGVWMQTGAVNFYQSSVQIQHSNFSKNTNSDDYLNIIRSSFQIKDTTFEDTFADAFDSDFSIGVIEKSTFINLGNDAMDFSGSDVRVSDISIKGAGDKGISVGEKSKVQIELSSISNSNIGLAAKDGSMAKISNSIIKDCNYALVAFKKKNEYSAAQIHAQEIKLENNKNNILTEKKSKIMINGKKQANSTISDKDIRKLLYETSN